MAVSLVSWYKKFLSNEKQRAMYIKYVSIVVALAVAASGSFFSYRWYIVYRERNAQAVLAEYIEKYHIAQASSEPSWASLEALFKDGAQAQGGSYLEPYFLLFQADSLIKEDKLDVAIEVMDKAIGRMSYDNLLLPFLEIKRALMQIDSTIATTKDAGLKKLTELAHKAGNAQADMAQYFLGQYYWSMDNIDEAKKVWQELVATQPKDQVIASPWAEFAQFKLQQITG